MSEQDHKAADAFAKTWIRCRGDKKCPDWYPSFQIITDYAGRPVVIPPYDVDKAREWWDNEGIKKLFELRGRNKAARMLTTVVARECIVCHRVHITSEDCPIPDTLSLERDVRPFDENRSYGTRLIDAELMKGGME